MANRTLPSSGSSSRSPSPTRPPAKCASGFASACYERLQAAEQVDGERDWLALLREIDTARVSTIHSFCASLLRAHAAEAGLDPTFGVLDQGDADVLQVEVIDDVLRERLAELDEQTLDLAAAFGLSRLKQQVAVLLGQRHHGHFRTLAERRRRRARRSLARVVRARSVPAGAAADRRRARRSASSSTLLRDVSPTKPAFGDARATLLELLPKLSARSSQRRGVKHNSRHGPGASHLHGEGLARRRSVWPSIATAAKRCATRSTSTARCRSISAAAREAAELGLALLRLTANSR